MQEYGTFVPIPCVTFHKQGQGETFCRTAWVPWRHESPEAALWSDDIAPSIHAIAATFVLVLGLDYYTLTQPGELHRDTILP